MTTNIPATESPNSPIIQSPARRSRRIAIALIACVTLVILWQLAAWRAQRPQDAFELTAEDFADFKPAADEWKVTPIEVNADDPTAPNIFAHMVRHTDQKKAPPAAFSNRGRPPSRSDWRL